nr:MAG: structural polyprotein [Chemarfal virus 132]
MTLPIISTTTFLPLNYIKRCGDNTPKHRIHHHGVTMQVQGGKYLAKNIERDTRFHISHLPPIKDLTRYGIESNPGPFDAYKVYAHYGILPTQLFLIEKELEEFCPQSDIFSEESMQDLNNRVNMAREWLYGGQHYGSSFIGHYIKVPASIEPHINLIEDIAILAHSFINSNCLTDRYIAIISFCKRRGSRVGFTSSLIYLASDLFSTNLLNDKDSTDELEQEIRERVLGDHEAQADEYDNIFAEARSYLSCYDKLKETAIYKKLYKFLLYCLTLGLLDNVKITFNSLNFSEFEAKAIAASHKPGFDMFHCFLDTILFICDRGYQFFHSGDVSTFFHSGSSYDKWLTVASKLQVQARFLNNPEPHGINRFQFLSELKDAIEKGNAIKKFTGGLDRSEKLYLSKVLNDLCLLEAEQITKKSAQMPRKDPFAVLIHGSSSICKSQLKQILFYHYGKVFGLPTTADYMYTRCPTDEYWSGFNSTQWCVVMDDIAFLKPNGEVDPTLKEMLQVKNSVPYTPPQASLEDKGRTPVRAELLIGTTNTKHLNLYAYFACPFAIARRMSYVITAHVKKEYIKNNFMADSNKIPITEDGEYMNIWNFEVSVPKPQCDFEVDSQQTKYEIIHNFDNIHDLLAWYITVAKEHECAQTKALQADTIMNNLVVCKQCYRAIKYCTCHVQQMESVDELPPSLEYDLLRNSSLFFKYQLFLIKHIIMGTVLDTPEVCYEIFGFIRMNPLLFFGIFTMIWCLNPYYCSFFTITALFFVVIVKYIFLILHYLAVYSGGIMWKFKLLMRITNCSEDAYRLLFYYAGERIKRRFTTSSLKRLSLFLGAPLTIYAMKRLFDQIVIDRKIVKEFKKVDKAAKEDPSKYVSTYSKVGKKKSISHTLVSTLPVNNNEFYDPHEAQVNGVPVPYVSEKPTFYYQNPYAITNVEISGQSSCAQSDILLLAMKNATARFHLRFDSHPNTVFRTTAFNFFGNLWIVNKHAFHMDKGTVQIIIDPVEQNVSRNTTPITFCKKDVCFVDNTDLCVMEIRAFPQGKNLIKYFPLENTINGVFKGKYIMISNSGDQSIKEVKNIHLGSCPVFNVPGYFGSVTIPTNVGDCGSMCLVEIGCAQVILGGHTSGNPLGSVFMQHISQSMLKHCLNKFRPQVERGVIPISAPGYPRKLVEVHSKSCIRWVQGNAHVMGSFAGYRPLHKSKVKDTYIKDYVVAHGYKAECGKPDMSWKPWYIAMDAMTKPQFTLKTEVLDLCAESFLNDILQSLGDKIYGLEVYTQEVALNGVDGVTFVDMINVHTSAGNPFKKSKKHFLTLGDDGKIKAIDPIIQDRINSIEECYENNRRFHPQFCNHLKDEAVSKKKQLSGKTRVFSGCELAWAIVVRKTLLSHIRLIQNNPFAFEAMPGIVAQSREWDELKRYVTKFGDDQIIAGDYGFFDKRMLAMVIESAFWILEKMAEKAGWNENDLRKIRCISRDTAWASMDFNGELIEIQGNPSGHPLTVIINCLVNSLYMRIAFHYISKKPVSEFRRYVNLATYGDDNIMGVSKECPDFNHTNIAVAMKIIGVVYTMADKEAESVPYIHLKDSNFLKRAFRYDKDLDTTLAPLDHSSIDKMLTSRLDSGAITAEAHAVCVIETALREYFFYGKEKFEDRRKFFKQLVLDCDLTDWIRDSTFPVWQDLKDEFFLRLKNFPPHELNHWKEITN